MDKLIEGLLKHYFPAIAGSSVISVLIAFVLFRWLGQKWIENRFAERLADYKHKQDQEIENFRFKINSLFNRVTKIHEKEFEVLPVVWQKLIIYIGSINDLVTRHSPECDKMDETQVEEFLNRTDLSESEKRAIRNADNRQSAYYSYMVNYAEEMRRDFYNYLLLNSIFLSKDIYDELHRSIAY